MNCTEAYKEHIEYTFNAFWIETAYQHVCAAETERIKQRSRPELSITDPYSIMIWLRSFPDNSICAERIAPSTNHLIT